MTIFLSSSEQIRTYSPSQLTKQALYRGYEYGTGTGGLDARDLNKSGSALALENISKSSFSVLDTSNLGVALDENSKGERSLHFLASDIISC
jgi:hypothetical protein